jgi:phage terminase large subunit
VPRYRILPPDPDAFVRFSREVLRERPYDVQERILRSVAVNRQTGVASATGVGKTRGAAVAALTWCYTGPYRTVVTTAPTGRQVRELMWKEIRKLYRVASESGMPLGGHLPPRAPELRIEEDWGIIGFSSSDEVNLQGFHSPGGTLFILDEAVGVKEGHWEAIGSTLTGSHDRMLALGNPTQPSGKFRELFKRKGRANCFHVSAFDTPNLLAGEVVIPGLVTREWVEDRREEWGETSPMWRSRVLGQFPEEGDNVLVPLSWIDAAQERWRDTVYEGLVPTDGVVEAGLDVARMGSDKSVMARVLFGPTSTWFHELAKKAKADTMEVAGWAVHAMREQQVLRVRVDADGIGAGVYDRLIEQGLPVVEMRGGFRATDPQRFVNARSEWLRPDAAVPISLPPDDALAYQATSLRFRQDSAGRIAIESKDEWRKRTGKSSPDELDAVAYAYARGAGTVAGVEVAWV